MLLIQILILLLIVLSLAVYFTLFKIRMDLNATQEKVTSALTEIIKVLEKK